MSAAPRVTVLMPVYNAEAYLREAIDSILCQTWTDFEFLVIDDASTDSSLQILQSYTDPRIRFVQNERNLKITATLNRGLQLARGDYIARMDADDISLPERLARQVAFLDSRPEIGICGVWANAFGQAQFRIPHPTSPEAIRCRLLFDSAFVHPAVVLRRRFLDQHHLRYQPLGHFEDYELWQRAAQFFPLANIPEYLFCYRTTAGSAYHGASRTEQNAVYQRIDSLSLPLIGIQPTEAELELHTYLRRPEGNRRDEAEGWLRKLDAANLQSCYYDTKAFRAALHERWMLVCYLTPGNAGKRWLRYVQSPVTQNACLSPKTRLRMLVKFLAQPLRR